MRVQMTIIVRWDEEPEEWETDESVQSDEDFCAMLAQEMYDDGSYLRDTLHDAQIMPGQDFHLTIQPVDD